MRLPAALSDGEREERLVRANREARNAVRLRGHPNIVTVHDVVIDGGAPWIVMQLVDGASLAGHIAEHGPLSSENTVTIARGMLNALAAAHAAGVVHRDVKPSNVLLATDGRALLTDFGIAVHDADPTLTGNGFVGSPGYCAPERLTGADAGAAGDMFSLGATLFEAVEGAPAFRRDVPVSVLADELPSFKRADAKLAGLITKLLAKDPEQRPTAKDAVALLDQPDTVTRVYETPPPTVKAAAPKPKPAPAGKPEPRRERPRPNATKWVVNTPAAAARRRQQRSKTIGWIAGVATTGVLASAILVGYFYFRSAYDAQTGDCVHKFASSWYREPCGSTFADSGNFKVVLRFVDTANTTLCADEVPGWTYADIPLFWAATSKARAVVLCLEPEVGR